MRRERESLVVGMLGAHSEGLGGERKAEGAEEGGPFLKRFKFRLPSPFLSDVPGPLPRCPTFPATFTATAHMDTAQSLSLYSACLGRAEVWKQGSSQVLQPAESSPPRFSTHPLLPLPFLPPSSLSLPLPLRFVLAGQF